MTPERYKALRPHQRYAVDEAVDLIERRETDRMADAITRALAGV